MTRGLSGGYHFSINLPKYVSVLVLITGLIFVLAMSGCASIGPDSVPRDRIDYADAMADSWKDQLVLNIVRLRYGDTPSFMDVSSVVASYTLQGQTQAGAITNFGIPSKTTTLPNTIGSVSAIGAYADRPTISYTPLKPADADPAERYFFADFGRLCSGLCFTDNSACTERHVQP